MKFIKEGDKVIVDLEGLEIDCTELPCAVNEIFNPEFVSCVTNGVFKNADVGIQLHPV